MKRIFILAGFCMLNLLSALEIVDLWSGREIVLPGTGKWELAAEHGRILGTGEGEVRFEIPQLVDGTTLDAVLTRDGKAQKVRFHATKPLQGIAVTMDGSTQNVMKRLFTLGIGILAELPKIQENHFFVTESWNPSSDVSRVLFFPDKRDFPLNIGMDWDEISFKHAKISGLLSVLYNKKEQFLELDGSFSYAVLQKGEKMIIVFSPEFDFEKIENVLLIKQLVKENEK